MIAILHAFIHEKAYTQQYGSASTTLALPDQSAHHDSVPMLAKGLAEPIIILLQLGKKIGGCLYSQIFQGWLQNAQKHFSMAIMCAFSVIRKQEGYTENTCCRIGSFWLFFFFVVVNITPALSYNHEIVIDFGGDPTSDGAEQASWIEAGGFFFL